MRFTVHSKSLISEFWVGLRPLDYPDLCSTHLKIPIWSIFTPFLHWFYWQCLLPDSLSLSVRASYLLPKYPSQSPFLACAFLFPSLPSLISFNWLHLVSSFPLSHQKLVCCHSNRQTLCNSQYNFLHPIIIPAFQCLLWERGVSDSGFQVS